MKLLIAAGGTGGHVFPGLAVAEALGRMDGKSEALFIGTARGLENRVIPEAGFRLLRIEAHQFIGRNPLYKVLTLARLMKGISAARKLLKVERPSAILGMGGFTSVPVILAGVLSRIPCFLHEQNVDPGLANKLLCRFARATFVSFADSGKYLKGSKIVHTGNPVRTSLASQTARQEKGAFSIFVFGGSRGARSINEAVINLLPLLEPREEVILYHQTGSEDYDTVKKAYGKTKVRHEVFSFTDSMEKYYTMSDLVICRAGATTIFELAFFRKAAILIPYPYSAGQHQWKNASYIETIGGGYLVGNAEATADRLYGVIASVMKDRSLLREMGERIGTLYIADAGERIIKGIHDGIS